jgi:hypothetical protein
MRIKWSISYFTLIIPSSEVDRFISSALLNCSTFWCCARQLSMSIRNSNRSSSYLLTFSDSSIPNWALLYSHDEQFQDWTGLSIHLDSRCMIIHTLKILIEYEDANHVPVHFPTLILFFITVNILKWVSKWTNNLHAIGITTLSNPDFIYSHVTPKLLIISPFLNFVLDSLQEPVVSRTRLSSQMVGAAEKI